MKVMESNLINKVYNIDARYLFKVVQEKIIDVTITSPPYFDLKDYGVDEQIGKGQSYTDYLNDLNRIFTHVYNITKDTGSLWVVLDTFKKNGEVCPLPFHFAEEMRKIGWLFQDIIIWDKVKTVPWSQKGQTKKRYEYILLFSKSKEYKYHLNRGREHRPENLKEWWIKYPERYNPRGKAPEEIWDFPIPNQGSWSNGCINHFCPFPLEMIERMLELTSDEGDVILDPFAGSGSVLIQSNLMKRNYIGFELNKSYVNKLNQNMNIIMDQMYNNLNGNNKEVNNKFNFYETIIKLRILKYARIMAKKIDINFPRMVDCIYVTQSTKKPIENNIYSHANYTIYLSSNKKQTSIDDLKSYVHDITNRKPLSKFGISPSIKFSFERPSTQLNKKVKIYEYTKLNTHMYKKMYDYQDSDHLLILSPIKMYINEKKYIDSIR
ncbi:site-specific DNA-methyltransferase [Methanohalophilus sp. RSK]|uniref:DNA-methyltransferase n=1 Tax=Methanohalophilus sp. RSK TaxID=2485783 RepID=UPI000F439F34|nr:DNA methyltransferase [Methanohalophilus sp. RSK]RNI12407.1 site-specific DNA-methyltransferase [Methanohalophilus sp. RSK]